MTDAELRERAHALCVNCQRSEYHRQRAASLGMDVAPALKHTEECAAIFAALRACEAEAAQLRQGVADLERERDAAIGLLCGAREPYGLSAEASTRWNAASDELTGRVRAAPPPVQQSAPREPENAGSIPSTSQRAESWDCDCCERSVPPGATSCPHCGVGFGSPVPSASGGRTVVRNPNDSSVVAAPTMEESK